MSPEQARGNVGGQALRHLGLRLSYLFEMLSRRPQIVPRRDDLRHAGLGAQAPARLGSCYPHDLPRGSHAACCAAACRRTRSLRLHDAADARIEIDEALAGPLDAPAEAQAAFGPVRTNWLLTAVVAGLALAGGWLAGRMLAPDTPGSPVRRFFVQIGDAENRLTSSRISPDGKTIAYTLGGELYLRGLDAFEARGIEGSKGAGGPFWSPDGSQVAYHASGTLWRVPAGGGKPTIISEIGDTNSVTWGSDETIYFNNFSTGVMQVAARGGEVTVAIEEDDRHYHDVGRLPGGRGLVVTVHGDERVNTLAVWANGKLENVLEIEGGQIAAPSYASGHILYSRTDRNVGIWALPFSLERLEVTGEPFLAVPEGHGASVSSDGTLIYTDSRAQNELELAWLDDSGKTEGPLGQPQEMILGPTLSPDGKRIAVSGQENGEWDIWVHDIERGTKTPLSFSEGFDGSPRWSADGKHVYFSNGKTDAIYKVAADGSGEPEEIVKGRSPSLSADESRMVFVRDGEETKKDIWMLDLESGSDPEVFLQTDADEHAARLSPNGRFVAYVSEVSGREEVYVKQHPSGHGRWQASVDGGNRPEWGPAGDRLHYIDSGNLMQVSFSASPSVVLGTPETVANGRENGFAPWAGPGAAPDGRFIVSRWIEPEDDERLPGIYLVENWLAEIEE